jgi:hypothetical protein
MALTSKPACTSASARCPPINPVAPVSKIFIGSF